MAAWTGLLPALAFVLTVGFSASTTLAAQLLYRVGGRPFGSALRTALFGAGLFYLLGILVLRSIGVGDFRAATPLVVGAVASVALGILPLLAGRRVVRTVTDVESETALRRAAYGWPLATLAVFGAFVSPGGIDRVTFFHLGGAETCLVGFCGISVGSVALVVVAALVAFLGPGLLGVAVAGYVDQR